MIVRCRVGSKIVDLSARLGIAAAYTVDEHRTIFAPWKPFKAPAGSRKDARDKAPGGHTSSAD
jgi:hypothetical protein